MAAIVTLTMNPALDVSTSTPHVTPSHKLRCAPPQHHAGGGGINVARVLRRLGADCLAAYPRGGAPAAPWPNCWRKKTSPNISSTSKAKHEKAFPWSIKDPAKSFASSCLAPI